MPKFKIVRVRSKEHDKGSVKIGSFYYQIHLLWEVKEMLPGYYSVDILEDEYTTDTHIIISKLVYCDHEYKSSWRLIASTDESLDMPSIDQSIIDKVVYTPSYTDFIGNECHHCTSPCSKLNGEKEIVKWQFEHRGLRWRDTCLFKYIKPNKENYGAIKYFYIKNKLYLLRKINNNPHFVEGFQELHSEEERIKLFYNKE